MRDIGCENCECQIRELTRSRSLTVREREALWSAVDTECEASNCPAECSTRHLVARVSMNLAAFVTKLDRQERQAVAVITMVEVGPVA